MSLLLHFDSSINSKHLKKSQDTNVRIVSCYLLDVFLCPAAVCPFSRVVGKTDSSPLVVSWCLEWTAWMNFLKMHLCNMIMVWESAVPPGRERKVKSAQSKPTSFASIPLTVCLSHLIVCHTHTQTHTRLTLLLPGLSRPWSLISTRKHLKIKPQVCPGIFSQ